MFFCSCAMAQKQKSLCDIYRSTATWKIQNVSGKSRKVHQKSRRYMTNVHTSGGDKQKHVVFHAAGDNPQRRRALSETLDQPRASLSDMFAFRAELT